MTLEKTRIYNNDVGPILNIISCQKCEKPDPEVVSLGG